MTFAVGMEGNNQRRTKIFSAILRRWAVTEMGRKSDMPVGVRTFGTAVTSALSQGLGTQPVRLNVPVSNRITKKHYNNVQCAHKTQILI